MPSQDGFLSGHEIERISEWVMQRWKSPRPCPLCSASAWSIGDSVVTIESQPQSHDWSLWVTATGTVGAPPSRTYQILSFVLLTCGNCAFTVFLNAYEIPGLMPDSKEEVSDG